MSLYRVLVVEMLEAVLSFVVFALITMGLILLTHAPILLVVIICGAGLIILECLPEPLNIFKLKDILFGFLGILCGLYLSGWRP